MMPHVTQRFHSVFRFGVVGIINNFAAYALFILLISLGLKPVVASGICYCVALASGYLANRYWSFQSSAGHAKDILQYLVAYVIGFVFALASISLLMVRMQPAYAQLICIVLTALVVFGALVLMRFGENKRHADKDK